MKTSSQCSLSALMLVTAAVGCSSEPNSDVPWAEQRTMVINASRTPVEVKPVSGDACLNYEDQCLKPNERCGKRGADIILDADGRLLDYVCYPGEADLSVEEIQAHQGNVAQNQNNAVIILDALDDGTDIEGGLSIDANNVVLYAEGPRTAVIGGSVLDGTKPVRGVALRGDLNIVCEQRHGRAGRRGGRRDRPGQQCAESSRPTCRHAHCTGNNREAVSEPHRRHRFRHRQGRRVPRQHRGHRRERRQRVRPDRADGSRDLRLTYSPGAR